MQRDERGLRVVVRPVPVAAQQVRGAADGVATRAEVRVELLLPLAHVPSSSGPSWTAPSWTAQPPDPVAAAPAVHPERVVS